MDDHSFEEEPSTLLPSEQQGEDLPLIDLESPGPPPSRRKRAVQIGLVLVALVVLLVTFRSVFLSSPTPSGPPPLPTIPPPVTLILSNISFGTVTINGQRQHGTVPMLLVERQTTYTITITASPFQPKSCTFSFHGGTPQSPASNPSDCSVGSFGSPEMTLNGITGDPTSIVAIEFTAADLPPDQQSQITTLLLHSITAQQATTVPGGSYIATGLGASSTITSLRTSAPVQAMAFLAPSANLGQSGFACVGLICQVHFSPDEVVMRPSMLWDITVPVALRWRFSTPGGSLLGDVSFPAATTVAMTLLYAKNASWSLSSQTPFDATAALATFSRVDCGTGAQILQQHIQGMNLSATMYAGQGITGCQISLAASDNAPQGTFLWRFGVLLAADTAAHHLLPTLPLAPQAEISAGQG